MTYAYCSCPADSSIIAGCGEQPIDHYLLERGGRRVLRELCQQLRSGDRILVARLSAFGCTARKLLQLISDLQTRGISVASLAENFDTLQPLGQSCLQFWQQLAALDHTALCSSTRSGQAAAKTQGRIGGRKRIPKKQIDQAIHLYYNSDMPRSQICSICKISKSTLYNYIAQRRCR